MNHPNNGAQDVGHEVVSQLGQRAREAVERVFTRLETRLEPTLDRFLAEHPLVVIGGVLLLGYLFSGSQRSRRR